MENQKDYAKMRLQQFKNEIDKSLDEYFEEERTKVQKIYNNPHSLAVIDALSSIVTRGGKRARGAFVYYTYQMMGGRDLKTAMNVAMAIEIIHAYLLIEDDFMDISDSRRGGPTAHKMLEQYHTENFTRGDTKHFGASMAMLACIVGSHMAMKLLNDQDIDPVTLQRLNQNLNAKLVITGHGQTKDVVNELADNVTEEDVFNVLHWKTAAYTYENPIHTGAILAGATDADLDDLSKYAIPGGIGFQIQDDILGVFGETDNTGKSNMDDIKEGKYTLLVSEAMMKGNDEQIAILKSALGNRELTEEDHKKVQQIFIDTGSLEYSKEKAIEQVKISKDELLKFAKPEWNEEGLNYLIGIADYMIDRDL